MPVAPSLCEFTSVHVVIALRVWFAILICALSINLCIDLHMSGTLPVPHWRPEAIIACLLSDNAYYLFTHTSSTSEIGLARRHVELPLTPASAALPTSACALRTSAMNARYQSMRVYQHNIA